MTLQNRVQPDGTILAHPARGALMGNRGILHGSDRQLGPARWRHRAWICCVLSFKDRRRRVMATGRYTELFFHDESVALAAGHRPCGECRRADLERFRDAWERAFGTRPRAPEMDAVLHRSRTIPGGRHLRRWQTAAEELPDHVFLAGGLHLLGDRAIPFTPDGYGIPVARPTGMVTVLTPEPLVRVLAAGYRLDVRAGSARPPPRAKSLSITA